MYHARAYSAAGPTSPMASATIPRRDPAGRDVQLEILFCGICHSDLHSVRNEWSEFTPTVYPIVPGHEIVGRVTKVGPEGKRSNPATSPPSAAWSTPTAPVPSATPASSSSVRT
jgi:uncharacterized zinc-type alcohol dehydrogenase-like protein